MQLFTKLFANATYNLPTTYVNRPPDVFVESTCILCPLSNIV